ncbi:MAG: ABC transporter permease [Bryobacteraceae bacterium]|nr:ABC transporter permease [Bryobacteraceae bacterium]
MRSVFRKPWFSAVSVLTLALGIASCTVVFSLVGAVLLRPLPYGNAGRIVTLLHRGQSPASPADFTDWKKEARSLDAMEAASLWSAVLTGTDAAEQVAGLQMTAGMFHLLGDRAALGRTFAPDDRKVVVLGDSIWRRRFGANASVVGSTVRLSGEPYTVVGVMAPDFRFPPFWECVGMKPFCTKNQQLTD